MAGFADLGDARIETFLQGRGRPIVLLPGGGLSTEYLQPLALELARSGHQVVRINPRGAGGSRGSSDAVTLPRCGGNGFRDPPRKLSPSLRPQSHAGRAGYGGSGGPRENGEILKQEMGDLVELVDIPGGDHLMVINHGNETTAAILRFLDSRFE